MSAALRYFSGVLSIGAGLLWMVPLVLAGGHLLDAASVQPGDALGVVFSLLLLPWRRASSAFFRLVPCRCTCATAQAATPMDSVPDRWTDHQHCRWSSRSGMNPLLRASECSDIQGFRYISGQARTSHDTMKETNPDLPRKDVRSDDVAAALWGGLALLLLMVATYYFPNPSGEPPSLWLFIGFWLRELFIVVPLVVVVVVAGLVWVWRWLRRFPR
jgi:hypothetical protein